MRPSFFDVRRKTSALNEQLHASIACSQCGVALSRRLTMQPVQVDVSQSGDLAYLRGTYVLTASDSESSRVATEKGRFIAVFRRQNDGSWKAIQQISNAEAPAAVN